jgi:hypothetical protein
MSRRVTFLLVGCLLAAVVPAGAQSLTISGKSSDTGPASKDFATETMGDPWDFEEPTDYIYNYSLDNGGRGGAFEPMPSFANGIFHAILHGGSPKMAMHFEGIPGAFNLVSKNGISFPIDANRFKRLSFRMRRAAGAADAHEFIGAQWAAPIGGQGGGLKSLYIADVINNQRINRGVIGAQQDANFHIYMMDLDTAATLYQGAWSGTMGGLYLNLASNNGLIGSAIDLDWVRLSERGVTKAIAWNGFSGRVTLTATNAQTGDAVQIFSDTGAVDFAASGSYTWDYGFLPAGVWTIHATAGAQTKAVTLTIDAAPVIQITEPDATGGRDFATTALADPWDLTNPQDLQFGSLHQIVNPSFTENGLEAISAPVGSPDPFVQFSGKVPSFAIDATKYHRLSFTLAYDHPELTSEILSDTWGGVARVIWNTGSGDFRVSQDIVTFNGIPNTFVMDLATLNDTNTQIEDQGGHPGPAWGGVMSNFWIRVNEAQAQRWFRLSNLKLAADDEPNGNGFFLIKWRTFDSTGSREIASANGADATVDLYYDTDTNPASGLVHIAQVNGAAGQANWDVSALPAGRYYVYAVITDGAGNSQGRYSTGPVNVPGFPANLHTDSNNNGLPDQWEARYGVTDPNGDDDGDGVSNIQEYALGTNPLVPNTMTLSEGATGFFTTRIALANPDSVAADATLTFLRGPGAAPITRQYSLPPWGRTTVTVNNIAGLAGPADVSTVVTSNTGGVLAERSMFWGDNFYGGSTGKAIDKARRQWFLAEGVANSFFDTFILLANTTGTTANVTLRFLRDGAGPVDKVYQVPPTSRVTIPTNQVPELNGFSFSTSITSDQVITVERSTYFHYPGGRAFEGGTEDAAIPSLSTQWYLAEGQSSGFFSEFILLGNPNTAAAHVTLRYLMPGGATASQVVTVGANSRRTIQVNNTDPNATDSPWNLGVRNTDVSVAITSDQAIAVERAMYWPGAQWTDGHSSSGLTSAGTMWGLAEGESGGPLGFESYILFANPNATTAHVRLVFLRTGTNPTPVLEDFDVPGNSRVTRSVGEFIARGLLSPGEQVGARIESLNGVSIVVERAMYWNGGGEFWGGGTGETGFKLK